ALLLAVHQAPEAAFVGVDRGAREALRQLDAGEVRRAGGQAGKRAEADAMPARGTEEGTSIVHFSSGKSFSRAPTVSVAGFGSRRSPLMRLIRLNHTTRPVLRSTSVAWASCSPPTLIAPISASASMAALRSVLA